MAPHSSTLAWKIPWTGEPVGCSPWGCEVSDTTERLHFHFSLSCIGGNGNPLQCSCLESPRDRGSLVGCRLWGHTESDTTEVTQQQQQQHVCTHGAGNESPLPYSCLENPMDRGAWQAAVHGVTRVGRDLATKPPPPCMYTKDPFTWSCHRSEREGLTGAVSPKKSVSK